MKVFNLLAGLGVLVTVGLAGCSTERSDIAAPMSENPTGANFNFVAQQTTINNYNVHFDGRTVAGGNTTFTYTVSGTGVDPSLSHFTVELPACAGNPVSYSPVGGVNINTNQTSGIYGIEWHLSVAKDNIVGRTYSITFAGNVSLGIVRAEVKTEGGASGTGFVYGPCAGSHVAGAVFVDADNDGNQSAAEGGIGNVTVSISDGSSTQTATTDASGHYDFLVPAGTYTVSVDAVTAATDFNEDLFATFTYGVTSRTVTVADNATATASFSFEPKADKVVADLDAGLLVTQGKPVRFWKSELRIAQGTRSGTYTRAQILAFLQQIETLGLPDPFQFGTGTEITEALAILSDNRKDVEVRLKRELLASELNFVSGNGLVGQADLHEVLLLWGEELLAPVAPAAGSYAPMAIRDPVEASTAVGMFVKLNGSTGGGGTDE